MDNDPWRVGDRPAQVGWFAAGALLAGLSALAVTTEYRAFAAFGVVAGLMWTFLAWRTARSEQ
ncbi:hypothetical protein [Rhodococcoides corynebacterioides]|uniref:hypothetical protein n=1 Tax=Rhodococcoides corynebacterioides TaxID=53972 RepID=UPI000A44E080|nr:hypothetical protein [Rhodococcus corynebacterioides]